MGYLVGVSPQTISPDQLKQALSEVVRGEVYADAARRGMYATDASHYQVMPRCVVVPKGQGCCGALQAHSGDLDTARSLARR